MKNKKDFGYPPKGCSRCKNLSDVKHELKVQPFIQL